MILSVIIVSWNTKTLLQNCLTSLFKTLTLGPFGFPAKDCQVEVIVVDNGSSDGSAQMIHEEFPQVKLIKNTQNFGFAKANNQGIGIAQGEYILLLNPDTLIEDYAVVPTMIQFMRANPKIGILGPQLLNRDGSLQKSAGRFLSLKVALEVYGLGKSWGYKDSFYQGIFYPDSISGAAMLIRREVFARIGLLNEDYFMYSEDADFCYRAKQAGFQIAYYPQAQIVHLGGQSSRLQKEEMEKELYDNKVRLFAAYHSRPETILFKILLALGEKIYPFTSRFWGKLYS